MRLQIRKEVTMTATTYATARRNAQSTVFGIVVADATLVSAGVKVTDGLPKDLITNRATYVTINDPQVRHDNDVFSNTKHFCDIVVPIVVSSRKESTSREVADLVISALNSNQATTMAAKLYNFKILGDNTNQISVGEIATDTLYLHNLTIGYRFNG